MRKVAYLSFCLFALLVNAGAQTFDLSGGGSSQPSKPAAGAKRPGTPAASAAPQGQSLGGWGGSIEVARLGRAAEQALAKGNYAQAANFAERATKAAPQNSRLWFLLGYSARLAGRTGVSLSAYQKGLSMEPGSVEGLSGMAQTYMRMGRSDQAKALLLKVIAANPRRANDLLIAGELFLQTGEVDRGIEFLERAEAMQPNTHTEVLLAVAYLKNKQPQRARSLLERAKARAPRNPDVFRAVASFYRESREYDEAIKALRAIPNKTPDVLGELGYTYEVAGYKKEAADTYVKAAQAAPTAINLQLSAASSLIRIGDPETGKQYLAKAQALDPNHYRLHAIRADLARSAKRIDEAIQEYNIAIANLPESVPEGVLYPIQLRLNLAEQYRDAGDQANSNRQIAAAEAQITALNITGPPRAEFLRLRASIRAAAGNFGAAEADLKEALQVDPQNINTRIQFAAMLWRMKRIDDARRMYESALKQEPNNRYALESMGYLAREEGDNKTAELFFNQLKKAFPNDYVAYVALGDLLTAQRRFDEAQRNYETAYKFAPSNSQVVSGGANAAIEAHKLELANAWLNRAKGSMLDDPRVMKERERYLFFRGNYRESARLGLEVIKHLPRDRDAVVYLAYNLYNLGRYDDALRLVREKTDVLPKEPNLPLLAAHIQKQAQLLQQAVEDYSLTIELDPRMIEAYVNRGYVLNDLQDAQHAAEDFNTVLKMNPNNGVARLGLSFSYLQMRQGKNALTEVNAAEKILGESGSTHLSRATAYRQMRLLTHAEQSYRAALRYSPRDMSLQMALADTLYHARKYNETLGVLNDALQLEPDSPSIYAQMAHVHAQLGNRGDTLRYVQMAESQGANESGILLATGDALMMLGDDEAAMQRFELAMEAPDASRVDARLAIAKLFARDGNWGDARQQISLGFAEARIGEAPPVTADNLLEAANLFTAMSEFDLAESYFEKARQAGAADQVVAIGLANTYLAKGDNARAEATVAALGTPLELANDYDYTMVMANVYRQRQDTFKSMTMFARASQMAGEDDTAAKGMEEMAGIEGLRVHEKIGVQSELNMAPIFEDATIYMVDTPFIGAREPRSSFETRWTNSFRLRQGSLPVIGGFFQVRNARGEFSLPIEARVQQRNTYDYVLNGSINPVLRLGRNTITFNAGVAGTFRRDTEDPVNINQNLFRQFLYMQTNAIGTWLQITGHAMHESGGFTQRDLRSRDLIGHIEFRVGRPWGNDALITGYSVRDLQFRPFVREFFTTSSYVGWEHTWRDKARLRVLGEYVRSWRVQDLEYSLGQMMRPAAEFDYRINRRWTVDGRFAYSRGQGGNHLYDNVQNGFFITYVKPLRRPINDGGDRLPIDYPLRFSVGLQHQQFLNFTGRGQSQIRPVVRLTFF